MTKNNIPSIFHVHVGHKAVETRLKSVVKYYGLMVDCNLHEQIWRTTILHFAEVAISWALSNEKRPKQIIYT